MLCLSSTRLLVPGSAWNAMQERLRRAKAQLSLEGDAIATEGRGM
jgi:hypothetical protein